jgi:hypothetical protein
VKESTKELLRIVLWIALISVIGYIFIDDQVSDWIEHTLGW